jgi:hypothetical protein
MGYYIETGGSHGKANVLKTTKGATIGSPDWSEKPEDKALICVVNNGFFEAAALCYNEDEAKAFNYPSDFRPKEWLYMGKNLAHNLANYGH